MSALIQRVLIFAVMSVVLSACGGGVAEQSNSSLMDDTDSAVAERLRALQQTIADLEHELGQSLQSTEISLNKRIASLETATRNNARLSADVDALRVLVNTIMISQKTLLAQVTTNRHLIANLQVQINELRANGTNVGTFLQDIRQYEQIIGQQRQTIADLRKQIGDLANRVERTEGLVNPNRSDDCETFNADQGQCQRMPSCIWMKVQSRENSYGQTYYINGCRSKELKCTSYSLETQLCNSMFPRCTWGKFHPYRYWHSGLAGYTTGYRESCQSTKLECKAYDYDEPICKKVGCRWIVVANRRNSYNQPYKEWGCR